MRQTLSRGTVVAAAATSLLSLCGSAALADSEADGAASGSPGVLSGNNLQVPVSVPVNVCGNSANVVGLLNPAFGNTCADGGSGAVAQSSTPSQSGAAGST
ncbi:chaplin, partial [Streptomyces sp. NPDC018957]